MKYSEIARYPLSPADVDELKAVMRGNESFVVRERAHGILLLFGKGRAYEDVADVFDVHGNTVRNWAERWMALGLDGLYDLPGRGVKPTFDEAEKDAVVACVKEEPRSVRAALGRIEEVTGKSVSRATVTKILKSRGKSWKRMRRVPKGKPTEEQYETAKAEIAELTRMAGDGDFKLEALDEAAFGLTPEVPYA